MNYNLEKTVAVFLGPSLERFQASQILLAAYHPPVRMGDIYRILGSGLRIIVLIDGLFHHEASVWQRELLEALANNVTVIGASSMGALRAAELHPFGMIGYGTIFEWYRDGVIDGDDEVALMHEDESNGFRALSEPMVNIRYNLMQAVRKQYISQKQYADLIEYLKNSNYAERSYDSLFNGSVVKKWPHSTRNRLIQFIRQKSVNLKKRDAIGALRYCATIANREDRRIASSLPLVPPSRYYRRVSSLKRGFFHPAGYLVSGEDLLAEASKDVVLINELRPVLVKNFFLRLWAREKELKCPADYLESYKHKWKTDHIESDDNLWLRSSGLTTLEFQSALNERALLKWMVEQTPHHFGLDFEPYVKLVNASLASNPRQEPHRRTDLLRQASEICYLAAGAQENGIATPSDEFKKFTIAWEKHQEICSRETWLNATHLNEETYLSLLREMALANWLIKKGPKYFGYVSWSFEAALIKELQITGRAAQLVGNMKSNHEIV